MLAAGAMHLSDRHQPDTLTAQIQYVDRAMVGPGIVTVDEIKLGRQMSILQLSLWQKHLTNHAPWKSKDSRRIVLCSATYTNLRIDRGVTMATGYEATPAASLPPFPDLVVIKKNGADGIWRLDVAPQIAALSALHRWNFYLPREARPLSPGVMDMWMTTSSGETISQSALPYVADAIPYQMHMYLVAPSMYDVIQQPADEHDDTRSAKWYPTIMMNMEVKARLPPEGAQWLNVRVTCKRIKGGRADMEWVVRDVHGEIIMLAHHVFMIVGIEQNLKDRAEAKAAL